MDDNMPFDKATVDPSLFPDAIVDWEFVPSKDGINNNLVIMLHGLGDTHGSFSELGRTMGLPQTAVLAVTAPHPLPLGFPGRMWHQSFTAEAEEYLYDWAGSVDAGGALLCGVCGAAGEVVKRCARCKVRNYCSRACQTGDWKQHKKTCNAEWRQTFDQAVDLVAALIDGLASAAAPHLAFEPSRVFLFGFSQGAGVALGTLLASPARLGGVIAVNGGLPFPPRGSVLADEALVVVGEVPVLLVRGSRDYRFTEATSAAHDAYLDMVTNGRLGATREMLDKGHGFMNSPGEAELVFGWMADNLHLETMTALMADNPDIIEIDGVNATIARVEEVDGFSDGNGGGQ